MRIALFTDTCLPTLNGVARALGLLIEHAARYGHEVALVSPSVSKTDHPGTALHLQLPGFELPFYRELQAARPWLSAQQDRQLRAFQPDLVHAATEALVGMAGRRWARVNKVPLVTSYCTNFPEYLTGYGLGFAEGWCWRYLQTFHDGARTTFCPSEATLSDLRSRGFHERMRIWSRGVDSELFDPARRSESLRQVMAPDAELILLYVGRIAPEKKIDLLLDAFGSIRTRAAEAGRSVAMVFVGDGPALAGLQRRKLEGVYFTGYRRGEALAAHYASADVFVFPSDTETFGQVVTEALASGLPAIAPARGGVVDTVIPGETGFLFTPGDAASLAEHTLRLACDDELRATLSRQARRAALKRSWSAVFEQLFADYAEALENRDDLVTAPPPKPLMSIPNV